MEAVPPSRIRRCCRRCCDKFCGNGKHVRWDTSLGEKGNQEVEITAGESLDEERDSEASSESSSGSSDQEEKEEVAAEEESESSSESSQEDKEQEINDGMDAKAAESTQDGEDNGAANVKPPTPIDLFDVDSKKDEYPTPKLDRKNIQLKTLYRLESAYGSSISGKSVAEETPPRYSRPRRCLPMETLPRKSPLRKLHMR